MDARADELNVPRSQRDWGLIGYMAFGKPGRFLFAGCMFLDLAGGALVLMSIVPCTMHKALPSRRRGHRATALLGADQPPSHCSDLVHRSHLVARPWLLEHSR